MEAILDVKIYLKSGSVAEFVASEVKAKNNPMGDLTSLSWVNIPGETRLFEISLDQVAAITYKPRAE